MTVLFGTDTGGTFTDLVVYQDSGSLKLFKAATTPDDPLEGLIEVFSIAAQDCGLTLEELLGRGELLVHGTTRATNAVVTGRVARTALLVTEGHPDILLFREGGRSNVFDWRTDYPAPYVPRRLTFEVPERIGFDGSIVTPLDERAVRHVAGQLVGCVDAIAVSLLWSIVNPEHELLVREILEDCLPSIPITLGHEINPIMREYRRTSSAAIDASLKPLMSEYLDSLERRLRAAGFGGRLLVVTSSGDVREADEVGRAPIHTIGSGPAMAPVAGRYCAEQSELAENVIVADAGGTTYDVSLVRRGVVPRSHDTWIGEQYVGHLLGFPSIDVRSIGAGGGSIAWIDDGGMLHVGPDSAGSAPGPIAYGRGGERVTVTDAALVLGYLDASYFLGGAIPLDVAAAQRGTQEQLATPLGLGLGEAAAATFDLVALNMSRAIEEITINHGIDPTDATLVAAGGASGLTAIAIARRLGVKKILVPEVGAALSAFGGLVSDLGNEFARALPTTSAKFDFTAVAETLQWLDERCSKFVSKVDSLSRGASRTFYVDARYPGQNSDLTVPLPSDRMHGDDQLRQLAERFHDEHNAIFGVADRVAAIEFSTWRARVRSPGIQPKTATVDWGEVGSGPASERQAYFAEYGYISAHVRLTSALAPKEILRGPAIVESPVTTVVIPPGASAVLTVDGNLHVDPFDQSQDPILAPTTRTVGAVEGTDG